MKKLLSIALIAAISGVFNTELSASVLDDKFRHCGGPGSDPKFTLEKHQTLTFNTTDLDPAGVTKIFNAPCIDTYDPALFWGTQPKFAANVSLPAHARARLKYLLGQDIPAGQTFQLIIQKSNSYDSKRPDGTSNGGIKNGQQEPISLKAQYVYTPHIPKAGWQGTTIDGVDNVQSYSVAGTAILDSALIDGNVLIKYPQRQHGLSLHSQGRNSTLSPDTFHLYRGGAEKPDTLDTAAVYPQKAYARLIKNEDKTKALLYKTRYKNWEKVVQGSSSRKTTPLPQEADRYGMIVMLSDSDFDQFVNAINRNATLREAISPIGFFSQNVNGVRLMDLFEKADRVRPFIPQNISPKEAAKLQKQQNAWKKKKAQLLKKQQAAAKKAELARQKAEQKRIAAEKKAKAAAEKRRLEEAKRAQAAARKAELAKQKKIAAEKKAKAAAEKRRLAKAKRAQAAARKAELAKQKAEQRRIAAKKKAQAAAEKRRLAKAKRAAQLLKKQQAAARKAELARQKAEQKRIAMIKKKEAAEKRLIELREKKRLADERKQELLARKQMAKSR